jgi:hypothetical protein
MADNEDSREKKRAYMRAWTAANKEKRAAYMRDYLRNYAREQRAANPEKEREKALVIHKKWRVENPEQYGYRGHKSRARQKGIEFLLTFEEWLSIWTESGKFAQRGTGSLDYCMARHGDVGPYAVGNVRICTNQENIREAHLGRTATEIARANMSKAHLGKTLSADTRLAVSRAMKAHHAKKAMKGG